MRGKRFLQSLSILYDYDDDAADDENDPKSVSFAPSQSRRRFPAALQNTNTLFVRR